MNTTKERRHPMKILHAVRAVVALLMLTLAAPAVAQPRLNIAGNYRGLMTGCLNAPQPAACRKGLTELVRLADEVDAKWGEWVRAAAGSAAGSAAPTQDGYAQALDRLNRGVVDFNRDMSAPAPQAK